VKPLSPSYDHLVTTLLFDGVVRTRYVPDLKKIPTSLGTLDHTGYSFFFFDKSDYYIKKSAKRF
jgi:hypothetical protein